VTREVVLRLARQDGFEVHERHPSREKLFGATEVFLTGTTVEVLPVVRVDGKPIGSGEPGPVTRQLAKRFIDQTG
jgi:branched-subunit amino acid aminotransferase/4-amino-4-deoxychorismate lyase